MRIAASRDMTLKSSLNNLRIRGISESVEPSELKDYFQVVLNTVKSDITMSELTLDRIHRLPKPKIIPSSAPRDVMIRIHHYHVKKEFFNK
ncbi:Hypothetical predicted protein, partial [Pelobates cultripes]